MAINFPNNPTVGQIYSFGGYSWQWNGSYWESYSTTVDYLPLSGGTVTGGTVFQSGLTANTFYSSGQVGIGASNPNGAAIIEIASTSQGVLFPRMTIAQRNAITSTPVGLILFVTDGDNEGLYIYKSTGWVQII